MNPRRNLHTATAGVVDGSRFAKTFDFQPTPLAPYTRVVPTARSVACVEQAVTFAGGGMKMGRRTVAISWGVGPSNLPYGSVLLMRNPGGMASGTKAAGSAGGWPRPARAFCAISSRWLRLEIGAFG